MTARIATHARVLLPAALIAAAGCDALTALPGSSDDTTQAVADKATDVASHVGGDNGYGGTALTGFVGHMPAHMGFGTLNELADPNAVLNVVLENGTDAPCVFELTHFASHMGLEEMSDEVEVGAGETVTVEMPCSEIIGLGPLEMPGAAGCFFTGGEDLPNTLAVPGFLGTDFACGGSFGFHLVPDTDDLDGDGDTDEPVVFSDAMIDHMDFGGPGGHSHGPGGMMHGGMMGGGMMGGIRVLP